MTILGIETSCDETGIAVVEKKSDNTLHLLSNVVASSLLLHAKTGGVIPEMAAREQIKTVVPVLTEALQQAFDYSLTETAPPPIDGIAVTYGPGLIGSLLVGVETAKTLSLIWNKPLIPVNHMHGHIYANFIRANSKSDPPAGGPNSKTRFDHEARRVEDSIEFPAIVLVVSGGHTDLLLMKTDTDIEVLGGTRDDAAGEAFDKIGRLLGLSYPAGATIAKLAEKGNPKAFVLPRPMIGSSDFDFSFSGLKTAALREVKKLKTIDDQTLANLCASVQYTIVDVLVKKTLKAAQKYAVKSILLGGGVAANEMLRQELTLRATRYALPAKIFVPQKSLCTDNGAMIAAAGFFAKPHPWKEVIANPELYY